MNAIYSCSETCPSLRRNTACEHCCPQPPWHGAARPSLGDFNFSGRRESLHAGDCQHHITLELTLVKKFTLSSQRFFYTNCCDNRSLPTTDVNAALSVTDLAASSPKDAETLFCSRKIKGATHIPVGIHSVKNRLKLGVWLSFLNHRQVVAERAQARLKLLVIKSSGFVLVKVPEDRKTKPIFISHKYQKLQRGWKLEQLRTS